MEIMIYIIIFQLEIALYKYFKDIDKFINNHLVLHKM